MEKKEFDLEAVQQTMELLRGKWKIPILLHLRVYGKMRFGQLQKQIENIGSKMLSKELKELEESGFIIRKVTATAPVRIDYRLSVYGKTLDIVFKTLSEWGEMHQIKNTSDQNSLNHSHLIDI